MHMKALHLYYFFNCYFEIFFSIIIFSIISKKSSYLYYHIYVLIYQKFSNYIIITFLYCIHIIILFYKIIPSRYYGTARDQVIGMKFATLAGKQVSTGGMVVKNVAGLDMGKLMIGSFGTLAVITSANFRLHPMPEQTHTFVYSFDDVEPLMERRNSILYSVLRPIALDIISPPAATRLGLRGHILAVRAGGSANVLARYERELQGAARMTGAEDTIFWTQIREFAGDFLRRQPNGVVVRISTKISEVAAVLRLVSGACICRAASGIAYVYLNSWQGVTALWRAAADNGWSAVVEFAPLEARTNRELWLLGPTKESAEAFAMMKKVKKMFDPGMLLNRSRLYGRI